MTLVQTVRALFSFSGLLFRSCHHRLIVIACLLVCGRTRVPHHGHEGVLLFEVPS